MGDSGGHSGAAPARWSSAHGLWSDCAVRRRWRFVWLEEEDPLPAYVLCHLPPRCALTTFLSRACSSLCHSASPTACTSVCATTAQTGGFNTKAAAHSRRTAPSAQRKSHRLHAFTSRLSWLACRTRSLLLLSLHCFSLAPLSLRFLLHSYHISHCVSIMLRLFSEGISFSRSAWVMQLQPF